MPGDPNKLSQFWQELTRRKVIKVIAMYAGATYVLIELANNVVVPLNLPDWTPRLVIIIALVGFPIMVVLSWIFDITPEGISKTASIDDLAEREQAPSHVKRRLKVSDAIIAVLIVAVGILAYPRIFKGGGNLKAMTTTVTLLNEDGEEFERQIFKEEYVHKLMILSFEVEDTDTINSWLKYGILEGVREDLLQFQYVLTYRNADATHLQAQITAAKINNCPYFLTGTYKVSDGTYKITSRLHLTKNGSIEKESVFQGKDLFSLFDSISLQTRIDLGVSKNIINAFADLPFQEYATRNLNAFRYYIFGKYSWTEFSTGGPYVNYIKALEQDSTFALASYSYAWRGHFYLSSTISAKKYISHAMRHRQRLPEYRDIQTRVLNYSILGEKEKAVALSEMQYGLQPYNIELLLTLIDVYNTNFLNAKAEAALIKLNELVPDYPEYQIALAKNYLISDKVDEGLKFIAKRIEENPKNSKFLLKEGLFYLHLNDLDHAEEAFKKAMLLSPENEKMYLLLLDHINFARNKTLKLDDLQKYTGRCRNENGRYYFDMIIHKDLLFRKEANQWGCFYYPVSDTSFIGIWEYGAGVLQKDGFNTSSYYTNGQGKVFKVIDKLNNNNSPFINWKQDSLILNAEKILEPNRQQESLIAFQKAYSENPEHYYLANYIQHLEFIQSQEYEKIEPVLEAYTGEYFFNDFFYVEILKVGNQFFDKSESNRIFKLLPLSEDQFMIPSKYSLIVEIVKEDNQIVGFKYIYINGDEFYFERTSEQTLASQNQ